MTGRVVVRSTEQKWIGLGILVVWLPGMLVLLWPPRGHISLLGSVMSSIFVVIGGVFMLRFAFAGVVLGEDGVTIRNPIKRTHMRWDEVRSFDLRGRGLFPGVGHAVLRDGRVLPIWGIEIPNPLFRRSSKEEERIVSLNARLLDEQRKRGIPISVSRDDPAGSG